jgi:uncharacterized protein (TIGR04141 family)
MPRQKSKAKKVSLYRLVPPSGGGLTRCVQQKYLDNGFELEDVSIAGLAGLLVTGVIPNPFPKWLPHVTSLTGQTPDVHNDTAAAVLLVPFKEYIYALCWGFGHLVISPSRIDPGFGLRFAIRRASPQQVRSLTIHTMDTLARTARTTVPGGATLQSFGMEEIGELVSRLVGRIPAKGLTGARGGDNDFITVRGADGLSIPLACEADGLLADIGYLHNVVENEQPVEGLEHFEHTKPLRPGDPVLDRLKVQLAEALVPGSPRVALSWPSEWDEEHGEASSYTLENLGRGDWEDSPEDLQLDHFVLPIAERDVGHRLAALKHIRVQALDSDGRPLSREISGDKWITAEIVLDGQRYVFHQGRWFNIGGAYLDMLDAKMKRIFAVRSGLQLPSWPKEVKKKGNLGPAVEGRYNKNAAATDSGLVCLDRKLIHTEQHPRGIESCDLFGPNGELIHVKRLDDSVSASHLFNQALVSAEALRGQPDAKERLRERIIEQSNGARDLPSDYRPQKVVLAFGGRDATPDALFTFSQVTLHRCAKRLGEMPIDLEITQITDSDEVLKAEEEGV